MRSRDGGFTLLELLVAVTLLAFLSVVLVAGLRFGTRIWDKSESADIDTNAVRAAQKRVARDLSSIYPRFIVADPADAFVDFAGTPHHMDFLSAADQPGGQMTRVVLSAPSDNEGVSMQYDTRPELARTNTAALRQTLLGHLKSVDFAYFGARRGEKTPAWHATWQHERSLPLLVRVRAATPHANVSWTELVVRPKIAADVSCVYDPIAKTCLGRR